MITQAESLCFPTSSASLFCKAYVCGNLKHECETNAHLQWSQIRRKQMNAVTKKGKARFASVIAALRMQQLSRAQSQHPKNQRESKAMLNQHEPTCSRNATCYTGGNSEPMLH